MFSYTNYLSSSHANVICRRNYHGPLNPPLMGLHNARGVSLRSDALLVLLDVAGELPDGAVLADPQTGTDGLQHGDVVGNHEDAALELVEGPRQGVHGLDIEVVGRLVEDEDVGLGEGEAGERHAGLLTTGQHGHLLQAGRAGDAEGAQLAAVLLVGAARVHLGHEADGAHGQVERVDVVLREEPDAQPRVLRDEALGRRQLADEQLEDRRLTGAVGADDADPGVELHVEVDVPEEYVVRGVPERDARHLDDGRRELLHFGEPELHAVFGLGGL